tara:strand:- start:1480 stop:1611 length:132 start_codon:yes stop_codon:yes gene_type:complete
MPYKKVVKKEVKKGAKAVANKNLDKLPPALKKTILKAKAKKKK